MFFFEKKNQKTFIRLAFLGRTVSQPAGARPKARLLLLPLLALLCAAAPIEGSWLTEDGEGVILIAPCPTGLCGRISGLSDPDTAKDWLGRPQCGLEIIHGLAETEPGIWSGTITDPRDGNAYRARLWRDTEGRLRLRGYLLLPLLGATQLWRPYAGRLAPDCRMLR
jgi:uncharacterized protein (DUF2147 family)